MAIIDWSHPMGYDPDPSHNRHSVLKLVSLMTVTHAPSSNTVRVIQPQLLTWSRIPCFCF